MEEVLLRPVGMTQNKTNTKSGKCARPGFDIKNQSLATSCRRQIAHPLSKGDDVQQGSLGDGEVLPICTKIQENLPHWAVTSNKSLSIRYKNPIPAQRRR